jgi:hypothetical protein
MRRTLLIVGIVIILAGLGGLLYYVVLAPEDGGAAPSGPGTVITEAATIDEQVLAYIRPPYKDDYEMMRISGYVDNNGETWLRRAVLEIQLKDSEGNNKELVKYEVTDLPPESRKTFDANAGSIGGTRQATIKVVEIEVVQ